MAREGTHSAESFLESMSQIPTAPFFEHQVVRHVKTVAREAFKGKKKVSVKQDGNGAVIIDYRPHSTEPEEIVFTAHVDHPGFLLRPLPDGRFSATRIGGLSDEQCDQGFVRLSNHLNPDPLAVSAGLLGEKLADGVYRVQPAERGRWTIATPEGRKPFAYTRVGDRIRGPVMDDFAGVAIGLSTMQEVVKRGIPVNTRLVLYRGEEAGFVGVYDLITRGVIDPNAIAISLETSSHVVKNPQGKLEQAAELGHGAILRIGDKMREKFDEPVLELLERAAERGNITVQKKRMAGGTCDASLMYALGLSAAGICLALKQYHNGLYESKTFEREEISRRDLQSATDLCVSAVDVLASGSNSPAREYQRRLVDETSSKVIGLVEERRKKYAAEGLIPFVF